MPDNTRDERVAARRGSLVHAVAVRQSSGRSVLTDRLGRY